MKIVFLFRDSIEAKYISNILLKESIGDALVLEKGEKDKKRKLKRIIKKSKFWNFPLKILDVVSIVVYSKICDHYISRNLLKKNFNEYPNIPIHRVDDANDDKCVEILKSLKPDTVIVFGTSILKDKVIGIPKKYLLNIHGGIVPKYRNVHSDFWAFYNKDYDNIGTTIIYLDRGVDSGDIALQSNINVSSGDSFLETKMRNVELAGDLIVESIKKLKENKLPRTKQNEAQKGFYKTPGFLDMIKVVYKNIKNIII